MESRQRKSMNGKWLADWKRRLKEKGLEKWFKRDNLIILVLTGVLLVIIALPMEKKDGDSGAAQAEDPFGQIRETDGTQAEEGAGNEWENLTQEEYAARLEQRLTEALSQVAGVGRVKVMITLKSSPELVVEREENVSRSSTDESDTQGGSRVIRQVETGESVVYSSEGTASRPYVVKTLPPEIEGVLVVAEGAGTGTVNRTVTAIVQALFDVESHKVSVVRMETK